MCDLLRTSPEFKAVQIAIHEVCFPQIYVHTLGELSIFLV